MSSLPWHRFLTIISYYSIGFHGEWALFSWTSRTHFWSLYVCVRRTLFCPVFHGVRPVPSTSSTGHFFPVSSYRPLLVRVRVRGSYFVLPSFAWRAPSSGNDRRRPLFSRFPVQADHGSVYVCVPRTWL